jgi:hypothetical protein
MTPLPGSLVPLLDRRTALQRIVLWGFSCWHRGHFIAYSPRAGRGSGLATIARGWEPVKSRGGGLRASLSP